MATRSQPMQRAHGRSARIRYQVHRALIDLLQDRTADELTIPLGGAGPTSPAQLAEAGSRSLR